MVLLKPVSELAVTDRHTDRETEGKNHYHRDSILHSAHKQDYRQIGGLRDNLSI